MLSLQCQLLHDNLSNVNQLVDIAVSLGNQVWHDTVPQSLLSMKKKSDPRDKQTQASSWVGKTTYLVTVVTRNCFFFFKKKNNLLLQKIIQYNSVMCRASPSLNCNSKQLNTWTHLHPQPQTWIQIQLGQNKGLGDDVSVHNSKGISSLPLPLSPEYTHQTHPSAFPGSPTDKQLTCAGLNLLMEGGHCLTPCPAALMI